jgi:transcription elongation factor GreA
MGQILQLTKQGLKNLKKELDIIINKKLPTIRERLGEMRDAGDLSENSGWDAAREDYNNTLSRKEELEEMIENAVIVNPKTCDNASIGCKITVIEQESKNENEYQLVDPAEADPMEGKLSVESPLGKALMGQDIGEIAEFEAPNGEVKKFKIKEIS